MRYAAIDFETADHPRASACAVGIVTVERGRIVDRFTHLIRPPGMRFSFTWLHGIGPEHVRDAPQFHEIWPELARKLEGVEFLAAHNAAFDRSVLTCCCEKWRLPVPGLPCLCTMKLARRLWGLRPTRLPDVCRHLGIELRHHDPASDAEACARIVIAAARQFGAATIRDCL